MRVAISVLCLVVVWSYGYAAANSTERSEYPDIKCMDLTGDWSGSCDGRDYELKLVQEGCWKMKSYYQRGLWPGEFSMSDKDFLVSYGADSIDELNNVRGSHSIFWQDVGGPTHRRKRMRIASSNFFHHAKGVTSVHHPFIITIINTFELSKDGELLMTTQWTNHQLNYVIPEFKTATFSCLLKRSK